jgi:hypothetical protein
MGNIIAHKKIISKIKIKEVHRFLSRLRSENNPFSVKIFQTDWFLRKT